MFQLIGRTNQLHTGIIWINLFIYPMKTSKELSNIITKSRQVGDTKIGTDGKTRYWTEIKPGKFDWRKKKPTSNTNKTESKNTKIEKLKVFLKKTSVEKLTTFSNNKNNDPSLRQLAYDELVKRGENVDDINLNTGIYGEMKEAFGFDAQGNKLKTSSIPELDEEIELVDYKDPDFIKREFGNLKTKKQRIEYDNFAYKQKISNPSYKTPEQEINTMNVLSAGFLRSKSPLMIISGGAGTGKSYNFHLVAKFSKKTQFDPSIHTSVNPQHGEEVDEEDFEEQENREEYTNSDYDYVEVPEVSSDLQLIQLLKEHNGKILLFDDTDNVFKNPKTLGILKKATASSGKRIIGKRGQGKFNIEPFEFTGKLAFLSNMSQVDFTKDEHMSAIYSRALKKDLYFTKQEQLGFIDNLKHHFNFTGVDRLEDPEEDKKEREEVFNILKENLENIDPAKFNSRTFKEALEVKHAYDEASKEMQDDPVLGKMLFGEVDGVWKKEVTDFLTKGVVLSKNKIEKAIIFFNL